MIAVVEEDPISVVADRVPVTEDLAGIAVVGEATEPAVLTVIGELLVRVPPALVHGLGDDRFVGLDLDVDDGPVHRYPETYGSPAVFRVAPGDLDAPVSEAQLLAELRALRQGIGGEPDTHTAQLEELVVLVEAAASLHVKEELTLLYPHVQADVAAAAGHGLGRVHALLRPDYVVIVGKAGEREPRHESYDGNRQAEASSHPRLPYGILHASVQ